MQARSYIISCHSVSVKSILVKLQFKLSHCFDLSITVLMLTFYLLIHTWIKPYCVCHIIHLLVGLGARCEYVSLGECLLQ